MTNWLNFYIFTIPLWFLLGGADVVYDPDVVGSLVKLLSKILSCSSAEVFICSTIRNQETYGGFKQQLGKRTRELELKIHECADLHYVFCSSWKMLTAFFSELTGNVLFWTETAGISHHVMTGAVSHVFPYNRASSIELIQLYTWHRCSTIKILFTNVHRIKMSFIQSSSPAGMKSLNAVTIKCFIDSSDAELPSKWTSLQVFNWG